MVDFIPDMRLIITDCNSEKNGYNRSTETNDIAKTKVAKFF